MIDRFLVQQLEGKDAKRPEAGEKAVLWVPPLLTGRVTQRQQLGAGREPDTWILSSAFGRSQSITTINSLFQVKLCEAPLLSDALTGQSPSGVAFKFSFRHRLLDFSTLLIAPRPLLLPPPPLPQPRGAAPDVGSSRA